MTQGAGVRAEIEVLNVEFWYRVDHEGGEGVAELFCEDGVYSVPRGRNEGREAIAQSYVLRRARGPAVLPFGPNPAPAPAPALDHHESREG